MMSGHKDVLPFITMVIMECGSVGLNILFKAATSRGLSYYVFLAYSNAISTILLLPLAFVFRRRGLPPFKISVLFKLFLLGLLGSLASLFTFKGIEYSSPTLASAIGNLSPALIFILAVTFRMERLNPRSSCTQAKVLGTLVSIAGALVVILYKGPIVLSHTYPLSFLGTSEKEWVKGGLLLTTGFLLLSVWSILQTHITNTYPDEVVLAILYNLCGIIISAPVCFIAEKDSNAWKLMPGIPLLATIYAGSFGLAAFCMLVYILHLKGPVYVASFKPLQIVFAGAMSFIFLGDALHLSSVVGAIVISIGFYAVLWGKTKEQNMIEDCGSVDSLRELPIGKTPLLESINTS